MNFEPLQPAPHHPGVYLAEALTRRDMTQADLARRAGMSRKLVSEIVSGDAPITAESAISLAPATGRPAEYWLQLDASWQAHLAAAERATRLEGWADWARQFPLKALHRRGIIPSRRPTGDVVDALLRFFGISSPSLYDKVWAKRQLAYRRGHDGDGDRFAVQAWLRMGEVAASRISCADFDAKTLKSTVKSLPALTNMPVDEGFVAARERLRTCGVALVMVEEFKPLTKINGAANWVHPRKVVVQVSSRGKRVDILWFNILHELGHVLNDRKGLIRVSVEDQQRSDDESEAAADRFAGSALIPPAQEARLATIYSRSAVHGFADRHNIAADIVVGRLTKDGQLAYDAPWVPAEFRYFDAELGDDQLVVPQPRAGFNG